MRTGNESLVNMLAKYGLSIPWLWLLASSEYRFGQPSHHFQVVGLPTQATREKFATRGIENNPSLTTAASDFVLQGTSISKLHHFTYDQVNTPKSNVFDKKMGKNKVTVKPLPTSLDPPHGDSRRRNEAMSQVMSTSPALPYHTNCL